MPAISEIIRDSAELGLMLPKSHSTLYERLRAFHVAEAPGGEVIGVCGLQIIWADLGEVMSLAVAPWRAAAGSVRSWCGRRSTTPTSWASAG